MTDPDLFAAVADLSPLEQAVVLERETQGNPTQLARLEALLAAHAHAGTFMARPAMKLPGMAPTEQLGDEIGRYTLLKKIGEGGCGSVFAAQQREPVRRRVALKVIKLGMDTELVIRRFGAERQALALMEHPAIARVYDAGTTKTGRPYFVMEYVDGLPITRFCDEHRLSLTARLELFCQVGLAVQHAHQKGVIHRDLKPSNILVGWQDKAPAPKIIDFGIAKAIRGRLGDQTLVTGLGQFVGTPAFMSPEQAELREEDIDTRSDIYALGVMLYELLAGVPPFDLETLNKAGLDEMRRIIREVEPPRPSVRWQALAESVRQASAEQRQLSPPALRQALRGDLDWIVLRCLEKNRARRYPTAQALVDDLRRHLQQEPVNARPPELLYVLRKFFLRNRLASLSAAAVGLALVAGTVVSLAQAQRATEARAVAQRRQAQAEELLTFMLEDVRSELQKVGRVSLLDAVGAKAMAYFAALRPEELDDRALLSQAKALTQIGEVRLQQKNVRYAEAEQAFVNAYQRCVELTTRHPRDGDMLYERAQAEYWIGHTHLRRGDQTQTRLWYTRYRDSGYALVALDAGREKWRRELISGYHNLAVLDLNQGEFAQARAGFLAEREAVAQLLAAAPEDVQLRYKMTNIDSFLGTLAMRTGDFSEARTRYAARRAGLETLVADEPTRTEWTTWLVSCLIVELELNACTGTADVARAHGARGETLLQAVLERDPTARRPLELKPILLLWQVALDLAEARARTPNASPAPPSSPASAALAQTPTTPPARDQSQAQTQARLDEARRILETAAAAEPQDRNTSFYLMRAWTWEARLRAAQPAEATVAVGRALTIAKRLAEETTPTDQILGGIAQCYLVAARLAAASDDASGAQAYAQLAVATLASAWPRSGNREILDPAARALALVGRWPESRVLVDKLQHFGYVPLEPWPQAAGL